MLSRPSPTRLPPPETRYANAKQAQAAADAREAAYAAAVAAFQKQIAANEAAYLAAIRQVNRIFPKEGRCRSGQQPSFFSFIFLPFL